MIHSLAAKVLGVAVAAASVFAATAAGAADQPSPRRNSCAFVRQIDSFKEVDPYTAIVQTSPSRRYKVTFFNSCREMKWSFTARVVSRGGVCLSTGDKIVVGRRPFTDHCVVKSVELLPPPNRTAMNAR